VIGRLWASVIIDILISLSAKILNAVCEISAGAASIASVEQDAKFAVMELMNYATSIYVIPIIVIETFYSIDTRIRC